MKRLLIIFLLGLVCQLSGYAQKDTLRISGQITDGSTGEPVPFASVQVCDTLAGTVADLYGVYSMNMPEGLVKLQFSAVGYKTKNIEVDLVRDLEMNVFLEPDVIDDSWHFKRWETDWKLFNCYGFTNRYDGAMAMFGLETRYDIWLTPLEVGLGFSYASALKLRLPDAYRYWTLYASLDCDLNRWIFYVGKNWVRPYVGVAAGGGQSFGEDKENIANFAIRAGFDISHFRLFFEQHFNTDKARGSYWGLTYYF